MRTRGYAAVIAALVGVLLVLAAFSVTSAQRTSRAAQRVVTFSRLSDAHHDARFALGQEESLERKYRVDPGPDVLAHHAQAVNAVRAAFRTIALTGGADDSARIARLTPVHETYLYTIRRLFKAVAERDSSRVAQIDAAALDPLIGLIESQLDDAAAADRAQAEGALVALRRTEASVVVATPIAFAVGLLLLASIAILLIRASRRFERQARRSQHAASHDPLTGLPNRALFAESLERATADAARDRVPFSLLMVDLDRFKEINDTLGHSFGDQVLRGIGPRVSSVLGPADRLARMGGDEFSLLLPASGRMRAEQVADEVITALREPFVLGELNVTIDASVGIVTHPTDAEDAETLVQRADIAMYAAKGRGGGVSLYDPANDPYDAGRLELLGDLRGAIDRGELELHYQPKFTSGDLRLVGVEALVRWRHPKRGILAPADFISLAEHTGAIRPLTLDVVRQAADQWYAWQQAGIDVTVAVNVSVANLLDNQLAQDLAGILEAARMPADHLVLEITESTVMADPERTIAVLERLAGMGMQISVDDYGTGYSSLSYLRRLPVDELKIDRSFVTHLATDAKDAQIVHSTIELGHSLGLRVVAEGVEDATSLALLTEQGCDLVQGFHLGRPVPPAELLRALQEHARRPAARVA